MYSVDQPADTGETMMSLKQKYQFKSHVMNESILTVILISLPVRLVPFLFSGLNFPLRVLLDCKRRGASSLTGVLI